jgi:hypothetical protein
MVILHPCARMDVLRQIPSEAKIRKELRQAIFAKMGSHEVYDQSTA